MSNVLSGNVSHCPGNTITCDVCQRHPIAPVYPMRPGSCACDRRPERRADDNRFADDGLSGAGVRTDLVLLLDSLDSTGELRSRGRTAHPGRFTATSRSTTPTTATSPTRRIPPYYTNDAIGMENNLWGEVIFTTGTACQPRRFHGQHRGGRPFGTVTSERGFPIRTFFSGYWSEACGAAQLHRRCPNCGSGDPTTDLASAPVDVGFGDQRQPLGLSGPLARSTVQTASSPRPAHLARDDLRVANTDDPEPDHDRRVFRLRRERFGIGDPDCLWVSAGRVAARSRPGSVRDAAAQHRRFQHPASPAGWVQFAFYSRATAPRSSTRRGWTTRSRAPSLSSRSWSRARSSIRRPATRSASRL